MKALAKLSLLLTLIIAGRYLRLTEPTAFPNQDKATTRVAPPDTLRFASYAATQALPLAPVSQRTPAPKAGNQSDYLIWY